MFFSYITAKERFLFQRLVSMIRTVLNPIVMLPLLLLSLIHILLDEFIQLQMSDAFKSMFEVVIQLGAILAVVLLYLSLIHI